jgi:hypothetical protein
LIRSALSIKFVSHFTERGISPCKRKLTVIQLSPILYNPSYIIVWVIRMYKGQIKILIRLPKQTVAYYSEAPSVLPPKAKCLPRGPPFRATSRGQESAVILGSKRGVNCQVLQDVCIENNSLVRRQPDLFTALKESTCLNKFIIAYPRIN